jgi:hypothetical protein
MGLNKLQTESCKEIASAGSHNDGGADGVWGGGEEEYPIQTFGFNLQRFRLTFVLNSKQKQNPASR